MERGLEDMSSILKVEDLVKYYGEGENQVRAVDHTSLQIERGLSLIHIYGEDSIFDVKKVQNHLCQECLDKLMAVSYTHLDVYKRQGMDFRHHIKFKVNIVLCVTVIGIIDQYLAVCRNTPEHDEVPAAGEKSCPLRGPLILLAIFKFHRLFYITS